MSNARAPVDVQEQPCHAAPLGRMRPKRARRATHLLPEHETALANDHFFLRSRSHVCAGLSPAQRDFSRRFAPSPSDGGGGNRTRARFPRRGPGRRRNARLGSTRPGAMYPRRGSPAADARFAVVHRRTTASARVEVAMAFTHVPSIQGRSHDAWRGYETGTRAACSPIHRRSNSR
jgi:hypothetical protein